MEITVNQKMLPAHAPVVDGCAIYQFKDFV